MDLLEPVLSHDAWGSSTAIAQLRGLPAPSDQPESELWMGAHESGPSGLTRGGEATTLAEVIAADPLGELGPECARRYAGRLPFLLKVLAPGHAISIQAHPSALQAQEVRARDASAGQPEATYVDDWAKPEMLLALTPFRVFVGLRPPEHVLPLVQRLDLPGLSEMVNRAQDHPDPSRALLADVLAIDSSQAAPLVRDIVAACSRVAEAEDEDEISRHCSAVVEVAADHPDDLGVAVLLLMHHRVLAPGDYLDVPAGVLHSYAGGLGIEVLANSDNVVRAGLTTKQVNIPELLRIVDPEATGQVGRAEADPEMPGAQRFLSHSDRFALRQLSAPRTVLLPGDGTPRLVFCLRGEVSLTSPQARLGLGPVQAAYLSAGDHDVRVDGSGEVYLVTVPTV